MSLILANPDVEAKSGLALLVRVTLVVRSRLDTELGARAVVERHNLATNLRSLGDGPPPVDAQGAFMGGVVARVHPVAATTVDPHHASAHRTGVAERTSDEQVVVCVIVIHVVQNGGDD